jgi:RHS repeat-associated protein
MEALMKLGGTVGAISAIMSDRVRKTVCRWSALEPARGVAVALVLACASISAMAQTQPNLENGFKHWGSYDSSRVDTVNLQNGGLILHAPLTGSYPQRGKFGLQDVLLFNSKTWQVLCKDTEVSGTLCGWYKGGTGAVLQRSIDLNVQRTIDVYYSGTGTSYSASGYSLTSADGAAHQLVPTVVANGINMEYESLDTSGYHLVLSGSDGSGVPNTATVTDRNGNQYVAVFDLPRSCGALPYNPPLPYAGRSPNGGGGYAPMVDDTPRGDQYCPQIANVQQAIDSNGNVMGLYDPNSITSADTLGRVLPLQSGAITSDYSGCVSANPTTNAWLLNYSAADGSNRQMKLCVAPTPLNTAFNLSGVAEAGAGPSLGPGQDLLQASNALPAMNTIILADGTKWVFTYDGYQEITSVSLPTGGSIHYTWTTISQVNGCSMQTTMSRAVASRTLDDGQGHTSQWTYTWGAVVNNTITNKVNDPLGNDTVHVFTAVDGAGGCAFYETNTRYYQGAQDPAHQLQQVDTTYYPPLMATTDSGAQVAANVVAKDITITVFPSGRVSKVHREYDQGLGANKPIFGNVKKEFQYDWGQAVPGPLLKETDTTYQWEVNSAYLTANLLDLPASVIVKDASGNRVAETDYTYDETAYLTPSGVTTQHNSTPPAAVRGNLTTVSHWLNTNGSWISSHTNWYDTGEPYQNIDPLGHITQMTYDPYYKGAYSTQTCTPQTGTFVHCVSGTYDFNTGVLTSLTNENATSQASGNTPGDAAHTSNFSYDYLWRLTSALAPPDPDNGGTRAQTALTYSAPGSPLSILRQKSITATVNDVATAYFDGLARNNSVRHVTPGGTVNVNTIFDSLGRPATVTNPFYATTDTTYGTTTSQYDGLGRVTQVTKQDGSISTVSYMDNCTIGTDEAGKQRRSCTNALSQLTSVDEPGDPNAGASTVVSGGGTAATGYVTINGAEQSKNGPPTGGGGGGCDPGVICDGGGGSGPNIIYDFGTVSINVGGHVYTVPYSSTGTTTGLAASLAAAINSDISGPVNATGSGPTVQMSSRATGSQVGYSISVSWTWDTYDFTAASFTGATSNGVTGGNDGPPVFGGHAYTTLYNYDVLGNLLKVTQQGGTSDQSKWRVRTFTYNSLSQLLTANNPESGTITYAYDPDGELTAQTDARGIVTSFTYDAGHRITGKSYSDGTFAAGYVYDQSGVWGTPGANAIGRVVLAYDGHYAATLYSYDIMGRIKQQWDCPPSSWVRGGCYLVNAKYNLAGDLTQLTYPDGRVVTNSYNSGNQLNQVQVGGVNYWSVTDTDPNIGFYPSGTPKQVTLGNGVTESTVLNQRLQTQEDKVNNSVIATFADHIYSYGTQNNGNILSVADQLNSSRTQSFTYDPLNRLATANESRWGLSFTYDPWGNFLQQSLTAGFATQHQYVAAANNRLVGYSYDAAGNLLNDTFHQYTFDGASRISQVDNGATKYTYDTDGNRVRKDTGSNFTEYFYFGSSVLAEQDQAGHWTDYIFANDKRIAKADLFDTRLHVSATTCNGCTSPYVVFNFNNIGDLSGHTIQPGDKLFVRQLIPSGMAGGVGFCFTNGNCVTSYPAVKDQNGQWAPWAAGTGSWNYRRIDLTPVQGLTINNAYMEIIASADGQPWHAYYDDVVVQWADGTVHPLYTKESSLATSQYGTGQTNPTAVVETSTASTDISNPAQTTYYYHGDQIGSSRLMTSGGGWPVWQGMFLPYGEEYNAQMGTNHYKFTGKERDDESGLDFFGARYYSNGLGRFTSVDPIHIKQNRLSDPQRLNLYTYGANNPLRYIDPDGRDVWDVLKGVAIGVVRFVGGPITMAVDSTKQGIKDIKFIAKNGPKAYQEREYQRSKANLKGFGTVVRAVQGNPVAQAQVATAAVNTWNGMSTTDKASFTTETLLGLGTLFLAPKIPALPSAVMTGTRYVGPAEAAIIGETGMVPNVTLRGELKAVFYTPESPMSSASAAQDAYQLGTTPTHAVELDTSGVHNTYGGNVENGNGIELITHDQIPATKVTKLPDK